MALRTEDRAWLARYAAAWAAAEEADETAEEWRACDETAITTTDDIGMDDA